MPRPQGHGDSRSAGALEVLGDALEVQGGIKVYASAMDYWNELPQMTAHVEGHRIALRGIDPSQPITWWEKPFASDRAQAAGATRHDAAVRLGFLAPVNGVSVDKWAAACVALSRFPQGSPARGRHSPSSPR